MDLSKCADLYEKAKKELCVAFFIKHIKPDLHRYKWRIAWANGTCFLVNKNGEKLYDNILRLEQKAIDFMQYKMVLRYEVSDIVSPLWEILCFVEDYEGVSISEYGKCNLPCYDPALN